ncbi:MAG: ribosome-associated translation inhibitor RaiA [Leptolyngbya sp. SIO1D8]|nr:ribosome-associated translation inhibitor RaiA [Leptolyngbya sp. SIO1D8]
MKLILQGKNIKITDAIHDHVHQKIGKAISHFIDLTTKADVKLSVPNNSKKPFRNITEVTVYAHGTVIRAEENHENLYTSIELVADKLSRQLQKYKDRKQRRSQAKDNRDNIADPSLLPTDLTGDRTPKLPEKVLRNKFFAMPPMSVEEALESLQLVDHDFYMFCNAETGAINVIYERNHGGYGIIQPRTETNEVES